ncbi:MAG: efflux RND transporter permease subunit, partial [Burkholderiales bacterium]
FNLPPGVSLGAAIGRLKAIEREIRLPATISTALQGTAQAFEKSSEGLGILLVMAILVVYIVLGILYESFIHPLTILSGLPFAGFGALLALAIFAPIYLVYFLIGLEAERMQAFASIPFGLFFYLFSQFAIFRARRYRSTRTIWRGVRFWMGGSGWSYAWRAGLWSMLVVLTFGLALPWYVAALERFKMKNSFFGDLPGRFDGTGGALFAKVWWLWVATVGMIAVAGLLAYASPPAGGAFVTLISLWLPFGYAIYKANEWRWWVSGIRFGEVSFECKLTDIALVDLYWIVIGWSWAIMMVLFVWIMGVFGIGYGVARAIGGTGPDAFAALAQNSVAMGSLIAVFVLGYLACALALGVVIRMYLRRDVWARVAASSVVYNLSAADGVVARGDTVNALGEGFGDSFDIGGF